MDRRDLTAPQLLPRRLPTSVLFALAIAAQINIYYRNGSPGWHSLDSNHTRRCRDLVQRRRLHALPCPSPKKPITTFARHTMAAEPTTITPTNLRFKPPLLPRRLQ